MQWEGQPGKFLGLKSHIEEQNTREREKGAFYLAKSEAYWPAASRRPRRLMALKRTRDLEETGREIALPTNWMAFKRVGKLHLRTPGFRGGSKKKKVFYLSIKSIPTKFWKGFLVEL